jgi:hypothetical protein
MEPTQEQYEEKARAIADQYKKQGHHVDLRPVSDLYDFGSDQVTGYVVPMYIDGVCKDLMWDDQIGFYLD